MNGLFRKPSLITLAAQEKDEESMERSNGGGRGFKNELNRMIKKTKFQWFSLTSQLCVKIAAGSLKITIAFRTANCHFLTSFQKFRRGIRALSAYDCYFKI